MKAQKRVPEVWVSPEGDNKADGSKARPVRSMQHAVKLMRRLRHAAGTEGGGRIILREGVHALKRPLVLDSRDTPKGTEDPKVRQGSVVDPLVICGAPDETAVLSGGHRITGWRESTVNGKRAWVVSLPAVKQGRWGFTQLWVNGRRAPRPRLPAQGTFRIESRFTDATTEGLKDQHNIFKPEVRFIFSKGDIRAFQNLQDVDFVALHFWIESRIPLASVDETACVATLDYPTQMQLTDNHGGGPAPYYLDNVAEALDQPGQWYLDRPSGRLTYLPLPVETIECAEIYAPVLGHILSVEGDSESGRHAGHIVLQDLTFSHNEYVASEDARKATPQAACHVEGAVRIKDSHNVIVRDCKIEHVGSYGVSVMGDSADCSIEHCTLRDLAAGGVKVFPVNSNSNVRGDRRDRGEGLWTRPHCIRISDSHIYDGGALWRQAVGVLIGNCSGIQVVHNHIHDFDYTGVSVGWTWGYEESHCYGNIIEWNHIHDIGRGVLSDMGGIYTLGQQPGTRLRYNHIHHVDSRGYGGWGIYPDEGSSDILIEFNIVHDTKCEPFSQHYGCNNIVRNNIFAFGRQGCMVRLSKSEPHNGFTFERNIVVTDGSPITCKPYNADGSAMPYVFDYNLYHDVTGTRLNFDGQSWTTWRKAGFDKHSVNADPKFSDLTKRDFTLGPDSAAEAIGFVPFNLSAVGPRIRL